MKGKFILILTESRKELIAETDYASLEDFHHQAEEQLGERIINLSDDFFGDPETVKVDLYVWDPYFGPEDSLDEYLDYGEYPELEAPEWDDEPIVCKCCGGSGYL